jgi:1,2-diacylglycerol 3-alpha-glucosyltransferase
MTVTIICDVLGRENNGTTIACMNLIRALKERGHQVRVVCMDRDKAGKPGWYIVPELKLGAAADGIIHKNGVSIARADPRVLEEAIRDCDLVHTTFVFGLSRKAIDIAKKYGKPVTSSFHCQAENYTTHLFLANCEPMNRRVYRQYYRGIYSRADCVHYPTQFIRDVFESAAGPTVGRVISNGVGEDFVPAPAEKPYGLRDKFVVLSVGRLSGEKDQATLIKAAARSKYKDRLHLIIAGEGPYEGRLRRLAAKLGVELQIEFFAHEELVKIINYSDLYVHPATVEIEAIACLEAICCGLVPVIADSPKSATKEFAPDERCLFRSRDPDSLAEKMDYWLEHPEEKKKCSAVCAGMAPRFHRSDCMDAMERMMLETAEAVGSAGK